MLIKIGFDMEFELRGPTPMVLMLFVHPSREKDLRRAQELCVEPDLPISYYTDLFGNRCARLLAPAGNLRLNLETLGEQKAVVDHVMETVNRLTERTQEAQTMLRSLQTEREIAERIERSIKQLRKTAAPDEKQRLP